ncbi:GNAT family N-acetyltransferase [Mucilaginibacter sp. HMF5004]|uniref:GNAT family N-acetyltransferase n=1 Tax=Mucilaginibacter rivuli TaxID=2857527 RepID=UPI001C5F91D2|nr:GNAT family N-acetyltransferase [Mucilaginibacter rivuli]MBW4891455.1 GNAT family N-acetyltransferase [Mucilaginibacter rivuli]
MSKISYQIIQPHDKESIELIADWYLHEWNIDREKTIQQLSAFSENSTEFQMVMSLNNIPIATGGIYAHVRLQDVAPKYKALGPWLALVFTKNEYRKKGYGALLCEKIQEVAKSRGTKKIFLFTHTAETLYKRLDWQQLERINLNGREIVVMTKEL